MQQLWNSTVKQIIYANILQLACGLIAGILSVVATASFLGGSSSGAATSGALAIVFSLGTLAGFIWYFVKIIQFVNMQATEQDKAAINQVKISIIINIVASLLALIPAIGWIFALIGGLIASIMLILAFSQYGRSTALPAQGVAGAGQLKIYAIVALVGAILTIIPVIGGILSLICSIVAIVFMFMGWSKIATACPNK